MVGIVHMYILPANGYVTEGKRTKHAEFGYPVNPVIKSISSATRGSRSRCVERRNHTMTAQVPEM